MNRRQLIIGIGGVASSGGLLVGSGAFSSTAAPRTLTVSVATDEAAFLGLEELGDGGRSTRDGGTVEFYFPSLKETSPRTGGDPDLGLGRNSVYEFARDAEENQDGVKGLLKISNQGTQPVEVYSEHNTDAELEIELYDVTDAKRRPLSETRPELDVGQSMRVGFRFKTFDTKLGDFNERLTIIGKVNEE